MKLYTFFLVTFFLLGGISPLFSAEDNINRHNFRLYGGYTYSVLAVPERIYEQKPASDFSLMPRLELEYEIRLAPFLGINAVGISIARYQWQLAPIADTTSDGETPLAPDIRMDTIALNIPIGATYYFLPGNPKNTLAVYAGVGIGGTILGRSTITLGDQQFKSDYLNKVVFMNVRAAFRYAYEYRPGHKLGIRILYNYFLMGESFPNPLSDSGYFNYGYKPVKGNNLALGIFYGVGF